MANRLVIGDLENVAIVSDLPMVTTYSEADIREPDKRNTSFSKALELYETNEINRLFENIFQVNLATQTFNPNIKTSASQYEDEVLTFTGYLQLLRITIKDGLHVYSCNIIGETGNFWTDISNDLLSDLDYSDLDHDYTRTNIINSWDTSIIRDGASEAYAPGNGYYYPLVNRGTILGDESIWRVKDFIPCIYDYEYLTKIFAAKGYTFDSVFLETEFFKRQITYPNLDTITLSQAQLDNRQFNVGRLTDLILYNGVTVFDPNYGYEQTLLADAMPSYNRETAPFFDAGNNYSGFQYTVPATGRYNFVVKNKYKITLSHTDPSVVSSSNILCNFAEVIGIIQRRTPALSNLAVNSLNQTSIIDATTGLSFINSNFKSNFDTATPINFLTAFGSGDVSVNAADLINSYISIYFAFTEDGISPVTFFDVFGDPVLTGSMFVKVELVADNNDTMFYGLVTSNDVIEGDNLEMNNAIPINIKQRDFVKDIMKRYNLIMQPDKTDPKKLIIEPYYDAYTDLSYYNGSIVNLKHRIDHNKDIVVNPMSELDAKTYIYKYKADKDYWNINYELKHAEVFGTQEENILNDFIQQITTTESIYSPTHNVANYILGIAYAKIYDIDGGNIKRITPNLRVLYANIKTTTASITFKQTGGTDLIIQSYGYAGHTDDPFNPTYDLNFGLPKQVYYSFLGSQFTNNNLFNRFHKPFIDQISDRDSKLVYAYLWLKKTDIESFSFRNKYFIEDEILGDSYYRINKIIDYKNESESVKCELLKLANVQVFTPELTDISDIPDYSTERTFPAPLVTPSKNVNVYSEYPVNVAASEDIVVGQGAKYISIVGSNGITIAPGVENVSIVNSSELTITENNITYVNNVLVPEFSNLYAPIDTTSTNITLKPNAGTVLVDCGAANKTITTPSNDQCFFVDALGKTIGKIFTIKKIDASAFTVTILPASGTIDGAANVVLTTQYQSVTIQTDGTNWYII
jgi:hypothetical protein